ncbi:hypothetical protein M758_12G036900 [Ceratodon purpureus]|uniref:Uncharacterized protein n=1 Tax=Ceratodon purpureus TaxID=3225 RepID=A0A8T0G5N0_CERPU|nr:hypothetical protein KC19_12G036400 [Ceratodon purpureus]KAG0598004.1 hypothetical protein M758_12G036900 [Ceratodon purpureus]
MVCFLQLWQHLPIFSFLHVMLLRGCEDHVLSKVVGFCEWIFTIIETMLPARA